MIYPDKATVLIELLLSKGIINDLEEWANFYMEYTSNMEENQYDLCTD